VPEEVNRVLQARPNLDLGFGGDKAVGKGGRQSDSDLQAMMTAPGIGRKLFCAMRQRWTTFRGFTARTGWRPTWACAGRELDPGIQEAKDDRHTKAGPRGYAGRSRRQHGRFSRCKERDRWPSGMGGRQAESKKCAAVALVRKLSGVAVRHVARRQALRSAPRGQGRQGWPAWWRTPSCLTDGSAGLRPSWEGAPPAGSANATTPACSRPGPATQVRLRFD